jgi:hypothetical protein
MIKLASYNCNSIRNSVENINELTKTFDIILLQELKLLEEDADFLNAINGDFFSYSFIKNNLVNGINTACPQRGVGFIINNRLKDNVKPIYIDDRILGLIVNIEETNYIIVNVYLPVDRGTIDSFHEFKSSLAMLEAMLIDCQINNIIIMGDFNASKLKVNRWEEIIHLCTEFSLQGLDDLFPNDTFTYLSPSTDTVSWLDHILCSKHIINNMNNGKVLYELSLFDHFPIAIDLNLNLKNKLHDNVTNGFEIDKFILWDKLSPKEISKYKCNLNEMIDNFSFMKYDTSCCNNSICNSINHACEIDEIYENLLLILNKASEALIKKGKSNQFKAVPGWNNYVKQNYSLARCKFLAWKEGGKPQCGQLLDEMKDSRKIFRQALRFCKTNENKIRNDRMVESLDNGNMKEFWHYVRSSKGFNAQGRVLKIDNETSSCNIANIFSSKYKNIFDDKNCQIENEVRNVENCHTHVGEIRFFKTGLIKRAVKNLNHTIGSDNIHSNHLLFGTNNLFSFLSKFYSICYNHSYMPKSLVKGIIHPLIKDKFGDLENSDNYRPIISSSVLLKTLEIVIKLKTERLGLFRTNARQMGFKKNSSTHFAYLMLKEVSLNYIKRKSVVYAAFLDLSKAFDKVCHVKLFDKLIKRNFDPGIVNLLRNWYSKQEVKVQFNNVFSDEWTLKNGVRQGGILSPYLFVLYIDDAIDKISNAKIGCRLRSVILNIIAYADDIVLLAPTNMALQGLIEMLCIELNSLKLTLNYTKSVCMILGRGSLIARESFARNIVANENELKFVNEIRYLGFIVDDSLSDKADMIKCRNSFYSIFNVILRKFHYIDVNAFLVLFNSYCMQFYGAELWYNSIRCNAVARKFEVGFHKAIKKIIKCPNYVSNHFVCNHLNLLTFKHYVNWIKIRFAYKLTFSNNILIQLLQKYFINDSFIMNEIRATLENSYDVIDFLENDLDALKSRILFVQRNEDCSNNFVIL